MKGKVYYREKYPKEIRIKIQNEDELKFLRILFSQNPREILKKFKLIETEDIVTNSWRKTFIARCNTAAYEEDGSPYTTHNVYDAIEEEIQNMEVLEDASHI